MFSNLVKVDEEGNGKSPAAQCQQVCAESSEVRECLPPPPSVREPPDMMSASEGGHGKAYIVRGVA